MSKKLARKIDFSDLAVLKRESTVAPYANFEKLDGAHPWQEAVPEGFVGYPVRALDRGQVVYFNYALAREMGLIPADHPYEMTPALERQLVQTFSVQIVNEYDQTRSRRWRDASVKPKLHMATRYLQLQHVDKAGRTSGDGRGVWNGTYTHAGRTWDVSSRGTGVTCLAPGAVAANRPLKTGGREFGYGCGLADVSELVGSAVLSEIFHLNGIGTERVLTVIDLGRGCGVGVRAAPNLVRPAHLFLYLKQGRVEPLRRATDYFLSRQVENGAWKIDLSRRDRYRRMLECVSDTFARFAARLERDYVFLWMEWDGDNVLADGGIIDYGSIRQFGLRHDRYRYDDVERFSTNLNEQSAKARGLVQAFAQLVDFVETGKRRPYSAFETHASVRRFDQTFARALRERFLAQVGFDSKQTELLMSKRKNAVEHLYNAFLALEKTKVKSGQRQLPDGINTPAAFNLRAALREMAASETPFEVIDTQNLLDLITSSFAKRADLRLSPTLRAKLTKFSTAYAKVFNALLAAVPATDLRAIRARAEEQNRANRITGNGAEFVVEAVLKAQRRGVKIADLQRAMDLFVASQVPQTALRGRAVKPASLQSDAGRLFQEMLNIASEFAEDI